MIASRPGLPWTERLLRLQVSHDGAAKPLTIGVCVHKDAKMSEVLDAVKQHPAASCHPEEELVKAHCGFGKVPFTKAYIIRDMCTKTHDHHAEHGCGPA